MPISAAGNNRPGSEGFTLIELMVVIALIGLATAAVVWALPDPRGRLADEAERFAGRARAAHDLAIARSRPVSLWVSPAGYGFDERRSGAWVAIGEKPLRVAQWGQGTRADVGGGRERVIFDPTGLVDHPLAVRLDRDNATTAITIAGDGAVKVGR